LSATQLLQLCTPQILDVAVHGAVGHGALVSDADGQQGVA
jgi:hypothetical protein